MHYIAYLHKDRNSDFGVSFPDFPGCITAGKTLEEARQLASEALSMHVEGMMEDKQLIPEPSTLDDLAKDPAMNGNSWANEVTGQGGKSNWEKVRDRYKDNNTSLLNN